MSKKRRVRFPAFEKLSDKGQAAILRGCAEDLTQARMQELLLEESGEKISNGSLGRYVKAWNIQKRKERAAQQFAKQTIESVTNGGVDAQSLSEALIVQAMLENMDDSESLDLETSIRLWRQHEELKHKQKASERAAKQKDDELKLQSGKLKLAEEQVRLQRDKFSIVKTGVEAIAKEVEDADKKLRAGEAVDPIELLNAVRQVYGLKAVVAHAA